MVLVGHAMNNSTLFPKNVSEIPFYIRTCVNCLIISFALMGNGLVIASILCVKRLRRVISNAFLLNLAVCDFMSVCVNITWDLAEHVNAAFPFGPIGCKVVPPMGTFAINSSVLTLLAISVERYGLIVHPMRFTSTRRTSNMAILCVHIVSFASIIPYAHSLTFLVNSHPSCEEAWSTTASQIYTVFLFLLQYALPLPLIVCFYLISWIEIRKNNSKVIRALKKKSIATGSDIERTGNPRRRKISRSRYPLNADSLSAIRNRQTHRTLLMFISVVLVFAICMSPNQVIWFYRTFQGAYLDNVTTAIFLWLTYSNSVLNPWIYGRFSPNFRRAYKVVVGRLLGKIGDLSCKRKQPSFVRIGQRVDHHGRSNFDGLPPYEGTNALSEHPCNLDDDNASAVGKLHLKSDGTDKGIKSMVHGSGDLDRTCMSIRERDQTHGSCKSLTGQMFLESYCVARSQSLPLMLDRVGSSTKLRQKVLHADTVSVVFPGGSVKAVDL